ncbi:MAG TPA: CDP-diacylglycerol--serine O-phosphatidyltransferase [Blastocatellia bacterium]|nr:CDP-diacylglycerol--serine O-phosphatidyltransferase [Blastocatellia bacterium]
MTDKTSDQATTQAPRPMRRSRKAVYVIPSLLTTGNIFCGFYSMMESLRAMRWLGVRELIGPLDGLTATINPPDAILMATEHFDRAAITIGFAALFDLLDGRVARMTNTTSEFGIELDSIADVVSFGLAPAVLAFAWGYGQVPDLRNIGWAASFLFLICGALRLARFNVQARQHNPNLPPKNPKVDKKAFVGLPIPFGAAMIASLAHFSPTPVAYIADKQFSLAGQTITISSQVFATGLAVIVILLAFLMVSTLRYSSFKNVGVGNRNPRIIVLAIALVVLAIWFQSRWALLIISTIYVAHGIIGKLWSLVKPRRAAAELELDRKPHR